MRKAFLLLAVLNAIVFTAVSQKSTKPYEGALEITSSALLNDAKTSDYSISVYLDGHRLDSVYMKRSKPIHMYLDYDKVYTFLFQKTNCKDKIVILNTQIPNGLKAMQDESFVFQVEMTQILTKNTIETEDLPIAVVMINKSEELLEASENYYKFTHVPDEEVKNSTIQTVNQDKK